MSEPMDFVLRDEPNFVDAPPPRHRYGIVWLAAGAALVVLGLGYLATRDRATTEAPASSVALPAAPADTSAALGGDPAPVTLPRLDESDSFVRSMVQSLTSDSLLGTWLGTKGLIRNATVVIANIADGTSPATHLRVLRPTRPFSTIDRDGMTYIDPRSYERYTPVAKAMASVDPAMTARAYATVRPLIEEAYRDLGGGDVSFDSTLERALVSLLKTPVPNDPVAVVPKGIGYAYADSRLEGLTAAQKQLLRFGPENARSVQGALRRFALALGIPASRLH